MALLRKPSKTDLDGLIVPYNFKVCVGHIANVSAPSSAESESGNSSSVLSVSGLGISMNPTNLRNSAGGEAVRVPTYPVRGPVTITNAVKVKDRHWRTELAKMAGYSCNKDVINYDGWVWVYMFDRDCDPVLVIELQHAWVSDYKLSDLAVKANGFLTERVQIEFMNMVFHEISKPAP